MVAAALAMEARLVAAAGALADAGVPAVVLKGTPLARRIYGRLDARGVPVDVDLLVRRRDVARATESLGDLGYHARSPQEVAARLKAHRAVVLAGPAGVPIDLHWSPFPAVLYPASEETVFANVEPFELPGMTVAVFNRPLTVIHLAAQYAQGGFTEIRMVADLAAAWSAWAEPRMANQVAALSRVLGVHHTVDYAFGVADRLGLLDRPSPLIRSVPARRLSWLLPRGRPATATGPDYVGMCLALGLADPIRAAASLRWAAWPPRGMADPGEDGPAARSRRALRIAAATISTATSARGGRPPAPDPRP